MASKKTLAVLGQEGVGKRTIVGTLIYKVLLLCRL